MNKDALTACTWINALLGFATMAAKRGPRKVTEAHKTAMAEGRTQSAAVRHYLEALDANRPKRGRKRTPESIAKRLATIEEELAGAPPLKALNLRQERNDLKAELTTSGETIDLAELESAFVKAARAYGNRKGISYQVWRETGVPADVLKKAGISRGSGG